MLYASTVDWRAQCAAVIPCLNEEAAITSVVLAVRRHLPTVVVVDDGSTDRTAAVAEQAGALVLRHELNLGKGAALETGLRWAHGRGFGWALTLDGDAQHSADDISSFFSAAEQTSARLVVGNRMPEANRMPWLRRWVNRWMSRRLSTLAGQELADSQCGFRLMNLGSWSGLSIKASRFEIESDLLLAFTSAGLTVEFIPVQVIYKNEQSKIHPVRDTVRWLRWWRQVRKDNLPRRGNKGKEEDQISGAK
jgi:glycosyltransferase involved in cell wall biosynthesis